MIGRGKRMLAMITALAVMCIGPAAVYGQDTGYMITDDLWIRAVISTDESGPVEGVWEKGGQGTTEAGDQVIWGYFFASPDDVNWGNENNPDVFVKIWFDRSGRVDVNFFHVSAPDIEVHSAYPYNGEANETGVITTERRYIRQYYLDGESYTDEQYENGNPPAENNPVGYALTDDLRIGSVINTAEKGALEAAWYKGGEGTTEGGHRVLWGYFFASPDEVNWGSADNPDVFVKVWFDASGRVDVNFFHVSVPDIEVYSDMPDQDTYNQKGTTTLATRYIRHEYTMAPEGFTTADIAGEWSGYFKETRPDAGTSYWFHSSLDADSSGNVTGGDYTASGGAEGTYTGGALALDENGVMTGSVVSSDGTTISVQNGKMDQSKTFGSFVSASDDGTLDIGMLVKNGGSFSTADLEGTWHGYFSETRSATGEDYWFFGTLEVDSSGNVTGGGYTAPGGLTGTYTGGELALDSAGILTGTVVSSDGTTITIQNGKMDQSKTFGSFVSSSDDDTVDFGILIKSGGIFSNEDLGGTWHGYFMETRPDAGQTYWFYGMLEIEEPVTYGELTVDTALNVAGGDYTASGGATGNYAGGALSLNSDGILTGTVVSSDGTTITVQDGKMDQGKTFGSFVSASDDGTLDIGILIKCTSGN